MEHTVYVFDGFHLDVTRRRLCSSGGVVLPLNSRALDCLLLLVANAGQLVEKRRLMETVWPAAVVEDNNLNQCILAIRRALGEVAGSNRYIMTVPGRGYCFVCPVRTLTHENAEPTAALPLSRRLTLSAAAGLPVLCLLVAGILYSPPPPVPAEERSAPGLVLRLWPMKSNGTPEAAHAAQPVTAMVDCLARQPQTHLEVAVRLVRDDTGAMIWSGHYVAGAEDVLSLQQPAHPSADSCSRLATE